MYRYLGNMPNVGVCASSEVFLRFRTRNPVTMKKSILVFEAIPKSISLALLVAACALALGWTAICLLAMARL